MRLFKYLMLLFCFFMQQAFAKTDIIDELASRFGAQKIVAANYQQTRIIKSMNNELKSSGICIFSQKDGVVWEQQKPFAMRLVLTENVMVQSINGKQKQVIKAEDSPQFLAISSVLKAVVSLDKKVLYQNFDLEASLEGDSFILNLKPKISPLDKIFSSIVISGGRFIDKMELYDRQQDVTTINFYEQKEQDSLDAIQQELFTY